MAQYAKAELTSDDGETRFVCRFDLRAYTWDVKIVGPVTVEANRATLAQMWQDELNRTTEQLTKIAPPSPAQGSPGSFYFAETCLTLRLTPTDTPEPGKPPAEPLEY